MQLKNSLFFSSVDFVGRATQSALPLIGRHHSVWSNRDGTRGSMKKSNKEPLYGYWDIAD